MDVFRETEIPFYLATKEFFAMTKARLNPGGVFAMNIYDAFRDHRIEERIANTAASIYPETYLVPAGLGSFLLVGSARPLILPSPDSSADPQFSAFIPYFRSNVEKVSFDPSREIFTDDRAPIETLYGPGR